MNVSLVPHWNNADGGDDLDTSRCFIGMERFDLWCKSLPTENTTIGLDERAGLIIDFANGKSRSERRQFGVAGAGLRSEDVSGWRENLI